MRIWPPLRGIPGLAFLVVALFMGPAEVAADHLAAANGGPGIALAYRSPTNEDPFAWTVVHAIDGERFAEVDVDGRWVLAIHVLDDGTLLLATAPRRSGEIHMARVHGERVIERVLEGTRANSSAHFISSRDRVLLLTETTAHLSQGPELPFHHMASFASLGYGIYDASAWLAPNVADIYVPQFETCSSSDHLEGASRVRLLLDTPQSEFLPLSTPPSDANARALPAREIALSQLGHATYLGPGGVLYSSGLGADDGCRVWSQTRSRTLALTPPQGRCDFTARSNDRHTVALFDRVVARLTATRAVVLHTFAEAPNARVELAPDARGRALALTADHTLWRYARQAPPRQLWPSPST